MSLFWFFSLVWFFSFLLFGVSSSHSCDVCPCSCGSCALGLIQTLVCVETEAGVDINVASLEGSGDFHLEAKVRKTPSWPRSWANFSLLIY